MPNARPPVDDNRSYFNGQLSHIPHDHRKLAVGSYGPQRKKNLFILLISGIATIILYGVVGAFGIFVFVSQNIHGDQALVLPFTLSRSELDWHSLVQPVLTVVLSTLGTLALNLGTMCSDIGEDMSEIQTLRGEQGLPLWVLIQRRLWARASIIDSWTLCCDSRGRFFMRLFHLGFRKFLGAITGLCFLYRSIGSGNTNITANPLTLALSCVTLMNLFGLIFTIVRSAILVIRTKNFDFNPPDGLILAAAFEPEVIKALNGLGSGSLDAFVAWRETAVAKQDVYMRYWQDGEFGHVTLGFTPPHQYADVAVDDPSEYDDGSKERWGDEAPWLRRKMFYV